MVLGLRHEAQFRGKSDVGDNVDRPEELRFLGAYLLVVGMVDMRYTFQMKRKARIGQYEKVLWGSNSVGICGLLVKAES